MKVTLEAVVGFVSRSQSTAMTKVTAPVRAGRSANSGNSGAAGSAGSAGNAGNDVQPRRNFDVTANDRRFLRSLRIAADETTEPVE
jgi:hypothetical protein